MTTDLLTGKEDYVELTSDLDDSEEIISDARTVSSEPKDWTVMTLIYKLGKGQIIPQPEYQREYVWDARPELAPRLIESLLLQIPIPPIYFAELPSGKLEVIDGQQRLTTLNRFVANEFPLKKLERMADLNGKFFKDLPPHHQSRIEDATIRSITIKAGSDPNLRYDVFERLNRGSMALNEMELRNCVYRGDFCDLLARLEEDGNWREVKGSVKDSRFIEREMILRFFAFYVNIDHYTGNLKRFLNEYMAEQSVLSQNPNSGYKKQVEKLEILFQQAMHNVFTVFGSHSARLYTAYVDSPSVVDGWWETKFSISALDIQASAMIGQPHAKVQAAADQLREAYVFYLLTNPNVRKAITLQPASKDATKTRWYGFKALVQEIMSSTTLEPRFFSYEFRQQLWNNSQACSLCKGEIHTFDDCTVDHKIPYSKKGKTVPENAQLAHRSCNARKNANLEFVVPA